MCEHNYCNMNVEISATLLYRLAGIQINYSFGYGVLFPSPVYFCTFLYL